MRALLGDMENPGHIQPHEHIFTRRTPAAGAYPALEISDAESSLEELIAYFGAGGAAIVDAQPLGAGRDAVMLAQLSRDSGVAIAAATGFHMPMFYAADDPLLAGSEEALYERYLKELTVGIEECLAAPEKLPLGARMPRAGLVKAAIGSDGAVDGFKTRLRAAARAAASAGAALMLHTEKGAGAIGAIELCGALGLAPERILLCHADRQASDYAAHAEIAKAGAYLEYDTIGRFKYHSDEDEVRLILHMLERGFENRLLLSLDTTAERLISYGGEIGLTYLFHTFLPMLIAAGVPRWTIDRITRDNPARALAVQE